MANLIYNAFKRGLMVGSYNLGITSGTSATGVGRVLIALVGSNYTPDGDAHAFLTSVGSEVVTPSNYVAYIVPSGVTFATNNSTNQGVLDMTDILIANVTFGSAVNACVLYGSSGLGAASDPLYAYIDFTTNQSVTAGTFQITWASGGVIALT
jgi:hypothetical protein